MSSWAAAPAWGLMRLPRNAEEQVIERNQNLDHDQNRDDEFKPRAAFGVDDVGQGARRLFDDLELVAQRIRPFLELIFVLEPCIKPFEIAAIPQHVRLFLDRDAA